MAYPHCWQSDLSPVQLSRVTHRFADATAGTIAGKTFIGETMIAAEGMTIGTIAAAVTTVIRTTATMDAIDAVIKAFVLPTIAATATVSRTVRRLRNATAEMTITAVITAAGAMTIVGRRPIAKAIAMDFATDFTETVEMVTVTAAESLDSRRRSKQTAVKNFFRAVSNRKRPDSEFLLRSRFFIIERSP